MNNNDSVVARLDDIYLEPPDDELPDDDACFSCYGDADMHIDGKPFCRGCAREEYMHYIDKEEECCICGTALDDEAYRVDGDIYCKACFENCFV